jgi:hypothetical protein
VALQRMMELFDAQPSSDEKGGTWPEFARYDCAACHHELRASGAGAWRRDRATPGAPGRPIEPRWPRVLAMLGLEAANAPEVSRRSAELDRLLVEFHAALTARPFGDRQASARAARAIAAWTETPIAELREKTRAGRDPSAPVVDAELALGLLHGLCRTATNGPLDYDSARQVAWAFRTIWFELLDVARAQVASGSGGARAEAVVAAASEIEDILRELDEQLILSLRPNRDEPLGACPPPNRLFAIPEKPKFTPLLGPVLQRRLSAAAEYDPEAFRRHFTELAKRLPPIPQAEKPLSRPGQ